MVSMDIGLQVGDLGRFQFPLFSLEAGHFGLY